MGNQYYQKAYITITLIAVNILVFLALSVQGMTEDPQFMLRHGAMYVPCVIEKGEYYRLVTCLFLHFGFDHLVNNMITLLVMGWTLELEIGRVRYILIYFSSGICGNILSAFFDIRIGEYAVSAGASGAIFGLIGALLYVAVRNKGRIGTITQRGLIFMILLTLYYGFTSTGVDNAAHIGGLASGFVLGILLYRKRKSKYRRSAWN